MYNGLILVRKNWQMSFHLLFVQFCNYAVLCHTQIFAFIHEVVRVMAEMAADYPILCGRCTINNLLFSGNKKNVINCCLLYILDSG